jgi:hypothetical protein
VPSIEEGRALIDGPLQYRRCIDGRRVLRSAQELSTLIVMRARALKICLERTEHEIVQ